MKGENEIGRLTDLGCGRDDRGADENRSGFEICAGEKPGVGDWADGAIVARKFGAIRMKVGHLHKAGERHGQHAKQT